MKPEDKAAFEAAWKNQHNEFNFHGWENSAGGWTYSSDAEQKGWELWQAACAHRDAQPAGAQGEPDAFIRVKSGKIVGQSVHDEMADGIYELHPWGTANQAPAVAVNEAAKWKAIAEFQFAKRVYPNELELGQGALDAWAKKWTSFDDAVAAEAEKAKGGW